MGLHLWQRFWVERTSIAHHYSCDSLAMPVRGDDASDIFSELVPQVLRNTEERLDVSFRLVRIDCDGRRVSHSCICRKQWELSCPMEFQLACDRASQVRCVQRQVLNGWRRASDLLDPDEMMASCPAPIDDRDDLPSLHPLTFREPCAATPAIRQASAQAVKVQFSYIATI